MRGVIPPLPITPSWRGAQLKKERDALTLKYAMRMRGGSEQGRKQEFCGDDAKYSGSTMAGKLLISQNNYMMLTE
jgi:hypothetical protein